MGDERDTKSYEIYDKVQEMNIRINEIDALVRGLTEEMLDLKAIVMKMLKDQRNTPVITAIPKAPDLSGSPGTPDIIEKGKEKISIQTDTPPADSSIFHEKVILKMQPDGTLKPERDYGEDIIIASAYNSKDKKKRDEKALGDDSNLIIADDE